MFQCLFFGICLQVVAKAMHFQVSEDCVQIENSKFQIQEKNSKYVEFLIFSLVQNGLIF